MIAFGIMLLASALPRCKWYISAAAILIMLAPAGLWYFRLVPVLNKQDKILIADFVNTTGDPIFGGSLRTALTAKLLESPFLNISSDEEIQETLKLMGQTADARVTQDIGRDICRRRGLKAMILGTISSTGGSYLIELNAVKSQSGTILAMEQVEAASKETVVAQLGKASTNMRSKLGEKLATIQKFNAPLEQATTSSLEALKAYTIGRERSWKGQYQDAITFYKRATELDRNFAAAYGRLAEGYRNTGKPQLAREAAQRGFDLRDRVTEREKFYLVRAYHQVVTEDIEQAIEAGRLWTQTYPQDEAAHDNLGVCYLYLGQFEAAAEQFSENIQSSKPPAVSLSNLTACFRYLNRFQEAEEMCNQAFSLGLDTYALHTHKYFLALIKGDNVAMEQQIKWLADKPNKHVADLRRSNRALFSGQVKKFKNHRDQAAKVAVQNGSIDTAASYLASMASIEAILGYREGILEEASKALALSRDGARVDAAYAFAFCGKFDQAEALAQEWKKTFKPSATVENKIRCPIFQAHVQLERKQYAKVIQLLQPVLQYERAAGSYAIYMRGLAYLGLGDGKAATVEFQKILDYRGLFADDVLRPLAYLQQGRAAKLEGDMVKSRKAYQDFLTMWKDADPDIPILNEAKAEYARLK